MMSFLGGMQLTLRCIRDSYFLGKRQSWNRSPSMPCCFALAVMGSALNLCVFMMAPFVLIYHPISNRRFGAGLSCNTAVAVFLASCLVVVVAHCRANWNKLCILPNAKG